MPIFAGSGQSPIGLRSRTRSLFRPSETPSTRQSIMVPAAGPGDSWPSAAQSADLSPAAPAVARGHVRGRPAVAVVAGPLALWYLLTVAGGDSYTGPTRLRQPVASRPGRPRCSAGGPAR